MEIRLSAAGLARREDVGSIASLLQTVFGPERDWHAHLAWQYFENPNGTATCVNAYDESDRLVAHYSVIPCAPFKDSGFDGVQPYLSLNTAVHPTVQRMGLFKRTAQAVFDYLAGIGSHAVLGVANENSVRGFVTSLDFFLMGHLRLEARLPFQRPSADRPRLLAMDDATLAWRFGRPGAQYQVIPRTGQVVCHRTFKGIPVHCVLSAGGTEGVLPSLPVASFLARLTHASVYADYGLGTRFALTVPDVMRPSPLHLICRPHLEGSPRTLLNHIQNRSFEFLDFDVV